VPARRSRHGAGALGGERVAPGDAETGPEDCEDPALDDGRGVAGAGGDAPGRSLNVPQRPSAGDRTTVVMPGSAGPSNAPRHCTLPGMSSGLRSCGV
jgi:hypothetical protein